MAKWLKNISSASHLHLHLICICISSASAKKTLFLLCTASNCIKMTCFTYLTYQLVSLWTCQCICLSTLAVKSEKVTEIWKIKSEESAIAFYVYFVVHVFLHANVCACEHALVFMCACVCALARVRMRACAHACARVLSASTCSIVRVGVTTWRIPLIHSSQFAKFVRPNHETLLRVFK